MDREHLPIKILIVHNTYQSRGGEDKVLESELELLARNGHDLDLFLVSNREIKGLVSKFRTFINTVYSKQAKYELFRKLSQNNFDIVHVHNFFPLLTPSIYDACRNTDVPVVQTLHNYRTICAAALLMRHGKICEKCVTGSPFNAVLHRCYKNSITGSFAVARMVAYHRKQRTWQRKVNRFIALTDFARQKYIEAGFPSKKIAVKSNFYDKKNGIKAGIAKKNKRMGALFAGRLSREKGVTCMFTAWHGLKVPLRVAGDGPLFEQYQKKQTSYIKLLGHLNADQMSEEMKQASYLVMPSEWYEGFPMVLVEAFAHGLPVVASRLGGMAEIVEDGITGLLFEPGNPNDLARKIRWMHHHGERCRQMGENAEKIYKSRYSPKLNYEILLRIYMQAMKERNNNCPPSLNPTP